MERYPEAEPFTRQAVEGFRPAGDFYVEKMSTILGVEFFFSDSNLESARNFLLQKIFFCQNHFMNMVKFTVCSE